jgi:mycothiol synthase
VTELDWRAPTRDDIAAWERLLADIEAVDQRGEVLDEDDLQDEFDSVWSDPEHNAVLVRAGGAPVAFGWLRVVPGQRAHHRITLWGGVHPEWRGQGIGRQILDRQVQRARDVAPTLDTAVPVQLDVELGDTQGEAHRLFERAGFEPVRWFHELQVRLDADVPEAPVPDGLVLRPWDESVDEASRLGHAEAFADHWGSEPRSPEEWRQWYTGHRGFRPDLSFVVLDGDQLAGFCLCGVYPQDWAANGYRDAWINTVGTKRAWRGRGIARSMLVASLRAMQAAEDGFERATLGVDSENPTGALGLYSSLGFVEIRRNVTMQREP